MCYDYWACALELRSHSCWSPRTLEPGAPQQEKPPQWGACTPHLERSPHSLQLEKTTQQWRPSTATNKEVKFYFKKTLISSKKHGRLRDELTLISLHERTFSPAVTSRKVPAIGARRVHPSGRHRLCSGQLLVSDWTKWWHRSLAQIGKPLMSDPGYGSTTGAGRDCLVYTGSAQSRFFSFSSSFQVIFYTSNSSSGSTYWKTQRMTGNEM